MIRRLADEGLAVIVIEHRVEDVLGIHPEHALFLSNGSVKYFGDIQGFKKVVDYREVKLPAPLIMEQVAREAMKDGGRTTNDEEPALSLSKGRTTKDEGKGDKEKEDERPSSVLRPPSRPSSSSSTFRLPMTRNGRSFKTLLSKSVPAM